MRVTDFGIDRPRHEDVIAPWREIRDGLDAAEFEPFFQPIVSLADGRISGSGSLGALAQLRGGDWSYVRSSSWGWPKPAV